MYSAIYSAEFSPGKRSVTAFQDFLVFAAVGDN